MMRNKKYYIGQWKQGQMNGLGIFGWHDGKYYRGYYENDKKMGYGSYSVKNNMKYEGRFRKGKRLAALSIKVVKKGTFSKISRFLISKGISKNQIKIPRVITNKKDVVEILNKNNVNEK